MSPKVCQELKPEQKQPVRDLKSSIARCDLSVASSSVRQGHRLAVDRPRFGVQSIQKYIWQKGKGYNLLQAEMKELKLSVAHQII